MKQLKDESGIESKNNFIINQSQDHNFFTQLKNNLSSERRSTRTWEQQVFSIFCVPTHDTTRQSVYFFHNSAIRSRKPGTTDALVKKEEKETLKPIIGGRYYYLIKRAFLFCSALTLDSKGSIINESVQYRDRVYFQCFFVLILNSIILVVIGTLLHFSLQAWTLDATK